MENLTNSQSPILGGNFGTMIMKILFCHRSMACGSPGSSRPTIMGRTTTSMAACPWLDPDCRLAELRVLAKSELQHPPLSCLELFFLVVGGRSLLALVLGAAVPLMEKWCGGYFIAYRREGSSHPTRNTSKGLCGAGFSLVDYGP